MASTDVHNCASCGEPAQKRCARCIDGVDIDGAPSNPYYCSKACQTAHWSEHKKSCTASNHRKQLYNTGEMLQELFYEIKRICHNVPIGRVEEVDDMVRIYVDDRTTILAPFPSDLFSDSNAERMGLAVMSCTEACVKMFNILSATLECSYNTIHIRTIMTLRKLRVVYYGHNKAPLPDTGNHELFDISLKDGNRYALDLTSAQFGHYRTVTPWEKYIQIFERPIILPSPPESFAAFLTRDTRNIIAMRINKTENLQYWIHHTRQLVQHWLTACLNAEMLLFETNLKNRAELISLAAAATGPNRKEFIDAVCNGVRDCAAWLVEEKGYVKLVTRIYFIHRSGRKITVPDHCTEEMANKLRLADELIDGKGTESVEEGYITHEEEMRQMPLVHASSVFAILNQMTGHR